MYVPKFPKTAKDISRVSKKSSTKVHIVVASFHMGLYFLSKVNMFTSCAVKKLLMVQTYETGIQCKKLACMFLILKIY